MTTICWDGRTLAADKQATDGNVRLIVDKLFKVPQGIVGFSGDSDLKEQMLHWLREGAVIDDWPDMPKGDEADDSYCTALLVTHEGEVCRYYSSGGPFPVRSGNQQQAIGSGSEFALAAMFCGRDAFGAVSVACALDIHSGMGIDTMTIAVRP